MNNNPLSRTVSEFFGKRVKLGRIGLEIECESPKFYDNTYAYKFWKITEEGSLRNGKEYVLMEPENLGSVLAALDEFALANKRTKFKNSIRTSVHVHVNVGPYTLLNVYSILVAYWLIEDALVALNGPNREGNLFCLRAKDAEWLPFNVIKEVKDRQYFEHTASDSVRYSALNLSSLRRFGSLEFRFIHGTTDTREIFEWVKALDHLCDFCSTIKTPQNILDLFEERTIASFLRLILGDCVITDQILLNNKAKEDFTTNFGLLLDLCRELNNTSVKKFKLQSENEDTLGG